MRQVHLSILTGLWAALIWGGGCPAPSVGPAPATPLAPPSSFNATSEEFKAAPAEEPAVAPPMAPSPSPVPPPGATAEATPSWTASSAGSVGCLAAEILVPVSLKDRMAMQPEGVGATVEVRNPETREREPLEAHELAMSLLFRDPSGNVIDEGSAGFYKSLEVGVKIFSTYVPRTIVGAAAPSGPTCEEVWEELLEKRFVLAFSYRREKNVYRGAPGEDVALLPAGQMLRLDPVVLAPLIR
ncbi:MAG TPA: hypothetical protein VLJ37_02785 [bacterium]|nr:hypothetical protein [bacterium]